MSDRNREWLVCAEWRCNKRVDGVCGGHFVVDGSATSEIYSLSVRDAVQFLSAGVASVRIGGWG